MSNNKKILSCFFISFFLLILIPGLSAETELSSMMDSEKTISMDLQDANLKDVLKIFSIQSGLNFIASEAVKERKVTLYLDDVPIKEAMEKIFAANKLNYQYDEAANIFTVNYAGDSTEPDLITRVFQLKFRSVSGSNLEKEKANLFASGLLSSKIQTNSVAAGGSSTESKAPLNLLEAVKQMLSKNGKVGEDSNTNSLIVTDVPGRFPDIEQVISKLDQPQPQVMLEVEILDVRKDFLDSLGFEFGDAPNILSAMFRQGIKADFFFGDTGKVRDVAANNILKTGPGQVSIGNYYSSLLNLLAQQTDTKYLARPRVLTLNNETAEIGVTKDEVMNMKITRTSSEGTSNVDITYERATSLELTPEGIGIFLRVTPHINMETGEITMVVNPKASSASDSFSTDVDGTTTFYRDPEVRSTKSIIKILDGDTVILGGLIHKEKMVTRQKVPFFGDIPIVGSLFRNKSTSNDVERELLVFITPHIMKDSDTQSVRGAMPLSAGSSGRPESASERKQAVIDLLNNFEKERTNNGQRKISQIGGAFN